MTDQVAQIMEQYDIPDYIWQPIMQLESSGNPDAVSPDGTSYGLFQINVQANPQYAGLDLTDPSTNATIAARDFLAPVWHGISSQAMTPGQQAAYVYQNGIKPYWTPQLQSNVTNMANQVYAGGTASEYIANDQPIYGGNQSHLDAVNVPWYQSAWDSITGWFGNGTNMGNVNPQDEANAYNQAMAQAQAEGQTLPSQWTQAQQASNNYAKSEQNGLLASIWTKLANVGLIVGGMFLFGIGVVVVVFAGTKTVVQEVSKN